MPTYSVDTVAVADTAARTRTRIATIQTGGDAMRGDIGLLQSCWTGTASDSMATCASDWHLTQLQVQSNLDQISLALDNAAVCYDDAETTKPGPFRHPDAGAGHRARTRPGTGHESRARGRLVGPFMTTSWGSTTCTRATLLTPYSLRRAASAGAKRRAAPHVRERRPAAGPGARPASRPGYLGMTGS